MLGAVRIYYTVFGTWRAAGHLLPDDPDDLELLLLLLLPEELPAEAEDELRPEEDDLAAGADEPRPGDDDLAAGADELRPGDDDLAAGADGLDV